MKPPFIHIGLTVLDIERIYGFYAKYFGFTKGYGKVFDEDYFIKYSTLFKLPAGARADMQTIESPDGFAIELFQFSKGEVSEPYAWQQTGYQHIALYVDDLPAKYESMKADGVEFFFPPVKRSDSDVYWTYLKDPEGNLVELYG